jgi:quercetin dioxygenase-like cupin family protein
MIILDFSSKAGRPLTAFGSRDVVFIPMLRPTTAGAVCMRVSPGGTIAEHPAAANQLFLVVEGEGWVRSPPDGRVHIEAGQAALWKQGEKHEAGSTTGLVAIILEGAGLQPELPPIG